MNHINLLRAEEFLKEFQRQFPKDNFPQGIPKENFVIDCVAFSESYEKQNLHGVIFEE